jgi:hypothetical protein
VAGLVGDVVDEAAVLQRGDRVGGDARQPVLQLGARRQALGAVEHRDDEAPEQVLAGADRHGDRGDRAEVAQRVADRR